MTFIYFSLNILSFNKTIYYILILKLNYSSEIIKVHTGFHSLITSCQTHQLENNCIEMKITTDEDICEKIFSDCESLFSTLLIVYKNDINTRDEKGNFRNISKLKYQILIKVKKIFFLEIP